MATFSLIFQKCFHYPYLLGLLSACVLSLALVGCHHANDTTRGKKQSLTIAGHDFSLQLALNNHDRFQGLSDVKSIAPDEGMIFVFTEPQELSFVMRKCYVPIDLIYLGPGGRIVSMHEMEVVPYDTPEDQLKRYSSGWPAQFAIELRAGSIKQLQLKVGQKIDLPLADLISQAQ